VRARAVVAIGLGVAAVTAVVAGLLLMPPERSTPDLLLFLVVVVTVSGVGTFLAVRVPGNVIGWLLLASGLLFGYGILSGGYAYRSIDDPAGLWPGTALLGWLNNLLFLPPVMIVVVAVPLVFPDGHLLSPRWRWVAAALAIGTLAAGVRPAFAPGPMGDLGIDNPFGRPGLEPLINTIDTLAAVTALPVFIASMASVVVRYRRGGPIERHQLKWLIAVTALAAASLPFAFVGGTLGLTVAANAAWFVGFLAIAALPIAIGIAILRYRLFEIDRIISRTLGWAIVTGVLVAVFAGAVVLLQAVLATFTQENTIAVAASTLIAFALFQPLRLRVQHAVDRRFDRSRYDGERTVDAFADRVRNEVDLGTLRTSLSATASAAVRPAAVGVWLRGVDS